MNNNSLSPIKKIKSYKILKAYNNSYEIPKNKKQNKFSMKIKRNNNLISLNSFHSYSSNKNKNGLNIVKNNIKRNNPTKIKEYLEKNINNLNLNNLLQNSVNTLEKLKIELFNNLKKNYQKKSLLEIIKNKFDITIQCLIQKFILYENKYKEYNAFIINLCNMIISNNLEDKLNKNEEINSKSNNNNSLVYSKDNGKNPLFINKKDKLLNEEEIMINLINKLSSNIKTYNINFKLYLKEIKKLFEDDFKIKLNTEYTYDYDIWNEKLKDFYSFHHSFYNDSKDIFHKLKETNSKKFQIYNNIMNFQNYISSNGTLNAYSYSKENTEKKNNLNKIIVNSDSHILNQRAKIIKDNENSKDNNLDKIQNIQFNINSNIQEKLPPFTIKLIYDLKEFLKLMDKLQEAIIHKKDNILQMKFEFSKLKLKLTKYFNFIENKNDNINNFLLEHTSDFIILSDKKYKKEILLNNENNEKDEYKNKYNQLLEEMNNQEQIIIDSKSKLTEALYENNELKAKIKKFEEEKQILKDKIKNEYEENNKKIEKENIDSKNNNILNNLEDFTKLINEKNELKKLINNCITIIFQTIKENSPDMVDDNLFENININEGNNNLKVYINFINDNIKKFQIYIKEITSYLQKEIKEKEKYEKEAHENLLKAREYKSALEQALEKFNIEDNNNDNIKDNNETNFNISIINNFLKEKIKNLENEINENNFNKSNNSKENNNISFIEMNMNIEKYYKLLQQLEKKNDKIN